MNKNKRNVFRAFMTGSQFGITMLAPIALCTFIGVFLVEKFAVSGFILIPLFFLGSAAGFRNCYILTKNMNKEERKSEED